MSELPELTETDRALYQWQMWVPGMGEEGQRKLKGASVLISRVGGLGGLVAMELAAAGVGRMILAHGGSLKLPDLNRQLLQTRNHVGMERMENIVKRLKDLNPDCEIVGVAKNIDPTNAEELVAQADIVVDAAPLFQERLALNAAAWRLGKPMVECAMHTLQATVTTFIPGQTGCLACYVPEVPVNWTRQFPVFGAVSGTVACLGAMEAIKLITGIGSPLAGEMLSMDLGMMQFRRVKLPQRQDCEICSERSGEPMPA
ncbi:molybdopterin/thiamine biosynthesis adenylyltransferase [Prosthecobacter fusiformis]|uniref:Molybdopterin/thiamine biosynthesis adenylyltransferase n=1 Tax=Prosthecobacter fusiformis TaxID=48464 RepID=A0A4V3FE58_9BACT|nr:HesA/MoeB/ThiF family protein [Prosthecobacter fusiformis]TDU64620.1 molybdopterin/thiamine biosynthesis adenylyltransferase [Prosthecobacter fusiformis]